MESNIDEVLVEQGSFLIRILLSTEEGYKLIIDVLPSLKKALTNMINHYKHHFMITFNLIQCKYLAH